MVNPYTELISYDYRRCDACDTTWKGMIGCFICGSEGKRHYKEALTDSWMHRVNTNELGG